MIKIILAVLIALTPEYSQAQQIGPLWKDVLAPTRATDWQANQIGVVGGIPNRTNVCATIAPYSGTADAINNAIAACPAEGVVQLQAGTFNLSSGIDFMAMHKDNVTLRGAGADQTFLLMTGSSGCTGFPAAAICIGNFDGTYNGNPAGFHNWTAGYAQYTTQITLDSVSSLYVGMRIALDQQDDLTVPPNVPPPGPFVSGSCDWQYGGCEGTGRINQNPLRTQFQIVTIKAINGNTLTISPGLHMTNWSASRLPQVWWFNQPPGGYRNGVENLSVDMTNAVGGSVTFYQASNSWVKGVRAMKGTRCSIGVYVSDHIEVRDSYIYSSKNHRDQSYGVELWYAYDSLTINNIMQDVTAPHLHGGGEGNVLAYSYHIYMQYDNDTNAMLSGDNSSHHAGSAMNLYEGNMSNAFSADEGHGTSNLQTVFRGRYLGMDTQPGLSDPSAYATVPVHQQTMQRYYNYIGNVLGTQGYHTNYEYSNGPEGNLAGYLPQSIWDLAFGGCCGTYITGTTGLPIPFDPYTISSLYRWGNYDVVTGAVNWNAAPHNQEIPSDQFTPTSHTLPPSMFLLSKPSWFGSIPFPPIGPDVTGGNDPQDPSGHTFGIPAKVCYLNVMKGPSDGTGGALNFNADACYSAAATTTIIPTRPNGLLLR